MPYSKNYSDFQRWIDGVLNSASIVSLDSCGGKPIKIVFEGEGVTNVKSECNCHSCKDTTDPFAIRSVLSNRRKNAFTVVWEDGTTTVVHCQSGDDWDDEKALAMCFTKKALGNKGNFNDKFNDALDNKMKVIPADPKVEAEAERFIEEIEALKKRKNAFGVSEQTATELSKAANKAANSLKEMINALTDEVTPKTDKTPLYRVFIRISGKTNYDSDFTSIEALRKRVREIAEELYGRKPYYYRTWMGDNGRMIMDFGHYTQFIEIEGITPDEYAKH